MRDFSVQLKSGLLSIRAVDWAKLSPRHAAAHAQKERFAAILIGLLVDRHYIQRAFPAPR